jgi:hypothetical protein
VSPGDRIDGTGRAQATVLLLRHDAPGVERFFFCRRKNDAWPDRGSRTPPVILRRLQSVIMQSVFCQVVIARGGACGKDKFRFSWIRDGQLFDRGMSFLVRTVLVKGDCNDKSPHKQPAKHCCVWAHGFAYSSNCTKHSNAFVQLHSSGSLGHGRQPG